MVGAWVRPPFAAKSVSPEKLAGAGARQALKAGISYWKQMPSLSHSCKCITHLVLPHASALPGWKKQATGTERQHQKVVMQWRPHVLERHTELMPVWTLALQTLLTLSALNPSQNCATKKTFVRHASLH